MIQNSEEVPETFPEKWHGGGSSFHSPIKPDRINAARGERRTLADSGELSLPRVLRSSACRDRGIKPFRGTVPPTPGLRPAGNSGKLILL